MEFKSIEANISDSNYVGVDLQITDARVALTFLDLSDSTTIAENKSRRIDEAHTAYTSILHFLTRLTPTEEQGLVLDDLLATIKTRLLAAGVELAVPDGIVPL